MSERAPVPSGVERRWDLVEDEKLREVARFFREHGPLGCLEASEALYDHALAVGVAPDLDRAEDLRHHIRLRLLLDRAHGRVLARR